MPLMSSLPSSPGTGQGCYPEEQKAVTLNSGGEKRGSKSWKERVECLKERDGNAQIQQGYKGLWPCELVQIHSSNSDAFM